MHKEPTRLVAECFELSTYREQDFRLGQRLSQSGFCGEALLYPSPCRERFAVQALLADLMTGALEKQRRRPIDYS